MSGDPEVLLGRLRDDLDRVVAAAPDTGVADQVERLYGVVAGEVRADAPMPGLAHVAGGGLVTISSPWGSLAGDVRTTVGGLLDWVDRRAVSGIGATPPPPAPVTPDAWEEAAAEAEQGPTDVGTVGIGVPILPDD